MKFSVFDIPTDLGPYDHPGGFPIARLGRFEIRGQTNEGFDCSSHFERLTFSDETTDLCRSCWRFCVPPLILAGLDLEFYYRSNHALREGRTFEVLAQKFEQAVRYYVQEANTKGFPFARILESDDVELQKNDWVWVIGYWPKETSIWDGSRALVINVEKFHDFLKPEQLDMSEDILVARFPDTASLLPSRRLPQGVIPRSLR